MSVLIEKPFFQQFLVEGPFVHGVFPLLFVKDCDDSDEADLTTDRADAAEARASIIVGIENSIVAEYDTIGKIRLPGRVENERRESGL